MAEKLTVQQKLAVENRGGRLLVSAAAGSGKTKVLVDRLMSYLTDPADPADLDEFLIITYTKAAASELRGKIAAKLTERIAQDPGNQHLQKQMQRLFLTKISTVHGFCGDILREYAYKLDLSSDFRIADELECREIRDQVLKDLLDDAYMTQAEDPSFRAFVDSQGLGRTDKLVPEIIEKVYDSARCHMDPDQWLRMCLEASDPDAAEDAADTVWGRYLLNDLLEYLDRQIAAVGECYQQSLLYPEFEKVSGNLKSLLTQLMMLKEVRSWDDAVHSSNLDYGRLVFPRKNPDLDLTERIKVVRSSCKKGLERKLQPFSDDSAQVLGDLRQSALAVDGLISLVRRFDEGYGAAKRTRRCLDFGDLEHRMLTLLLGRNRSTPTAAAGEIAKRYREIMVDEYQDSNGVQDAIFATLTEQRQNCFLVGDVKQSIYQFRLADPGIFLEKYEKYLPAQEAGDRQGRKILLSHNFRSGCEIIEAVNDVFTRCMRPKVGGLRYSEAEMLREGVPHKPLPDPAVELYAIEVSEETYPEEAEFVAERICRMLEEGTMIRDTADTLRPVQPEDIVILLRSPNSGGSYFVKALEARNIRCTSGAGTDLLQTQEVATVRSFLQVILNPRQDIPLISTLASPIFGFTADRLARIRSHSKKGSFYDALVLDAEPQSIHFLQTLSRLRQSARMCSLTELLEECYRDTRLDSIYGAMPGGETKSANLQMFYQLAVDFEKGSVRDLSQFLEHLTALESKGIPGMGVSASGCVTMMSIHKSKGLEFPVVFLCNLSKKFNQEDLRAQILCDKELGLGLSIADSMSRIRYPSIAKRAIAAKMASEHISEEMRVLYVALTRARDRLIMTYASRNLENDLRETALRADYENGELVCREAGCMGDWILLSALGKTEAGQLHTLGERPRETNMGAYPWKICVAEAPEKVSGNRTSGEKKRAVPEKTLEALEKRLAFSYPFPAATTAPSKQTATERKGRVKDDEAAQNAAAGRKSFHSWRKPSFVSGQPDNTDYGNAVHKLMQNLRFDCCEDAVSVQKEIVRLTENGLLTKEQAGMLRSEKIAAFFRTDVGQSLLRGVPCLREFKFSILDDGNHYGSGLDGEQVLLQGVVDCALIEEDGLIIVDFKTDRISPEQCAETVRRYRPQVEAYAHAMSRIYEMPIKEKYLYFFQLDQLIAL